MNPDTDSALNAHRLRPYVVAPSPEDFLSQPDGVFGASNSYNHIAAAAASTSSSGRYTSISDIYGGVNAVVAPPDGLLPVHNPADTLGDVLSKLASAGALSFASIACVMPFEVAKTLLQVQWIPKADVELLNDDDDQEDVDNASHLEEHGNVYDPADSLDDEQEAQAYFRDLTEGNHFAWQREDGPRQNTQRRRRFRGQSTDEAHEGAGERLSATGVTPSVTVSRPATIHRDTAGYIVRRSIFDQDTKPDWILPFTVTGGVWDMMKAVGRWKPEGWLCLWKGQLTTFVMETLSSTLQPFLFSVLAAALLRDSHFSTLPLVHVPRPLKPLLVTITSHVLSSLILSPLDLVRTRLICQSGQSRHRKYSGPVDALRKIHKEEGGILYGLYAHPSLCVPALLDSLVRSTFTLGIPLFIERSLHVSQDNNHILYGLAELTLATASLVVTLPIETARRRLQLQSRASVTGQAGIKTYKPAVETRPKAYSNIAEAVYRILTEETGRLHLYSPEQKPRRPSQSGRRPSMTNVKGEQQRRPSFLSSRRPTAAGFADRSYSFSAEGQSGDGSAGTTAADPRSGPTLNPSSEDTGRLSVPEDGLTEGAEGTAQRPLEPSEMPLFAGVTQLYRGFSLGVGTNLIVFVLGLVAGKGDVSTGWTEM